MKKRGRKKKVRRETGGITLLQRENFCWIKGRMKEEDNQRKTV